MEDCYKMSKIKATSIKCENCKAEVNLDFDNLIGFCPYCGAKLVLDLEEDLGSVLIEKEKTKQSKEKTSRAAIKGANDLKKTMMDNMFFIVMMLICVVPMIFMSITSNREREQHLKKGEINPPKSAESLEKENYLNVEQLFKSAGFENIKLVKQDDLIIGIVKKEGEVENVSINGDTSFGAGEFFDRDATVIITYHTAK